MCSGEPPDLTSVPTPHDQEAAMAIGLGTLLLIIIVIALLT